MGMIQGAKFQIAVLRLSKHTHGDLVDNKDELKKILDSVPLPSVNSWQVTTNGLPYNEVETRLLLKAHQDAKVLAVKLGKDGLTFYSAKDTGQTPVTVDLQENGKIILNKPSEPDSPASWEKKDGINVNGTPNKLSEVNTRCEEQTTKKLSACNTSDSLLKALVYDLDEENAPILVFVFSETDHNTVLKKLIDNIFKTNWRWKYFIGYNGFTSQQYQLRQAESFFTGKKSRATRTRRGSDGKVETESSNL